MKPKKMLGLENVRKCLIGTLIFWMSEWLLSFFPLSSDMQPHFYQNIIIIGGNTLFPGFRERLEAELRSLVPAHLPVSVLLPQK